MKKEEKTLLTKTKILNAAMEEFGKKGYEGGTINHICNTGINKGLIYHNFVNRDTLYLTCVKYSCENFAHYISQNGADDNVSSYMAARKEYFQNNEEEAHLFFEALLNPPSNLITDIHEILQPIFELNNRVYQTILSRLSFREGVTKEDAEKYFFLMQEMFNGYFSSPKFLNQSTDEIMNQHEMNIPKLLEYMLYGIAKKEEDH